MLDVLIEGSAEDSPEERIQDGAIEPFDKAVGLRLSHLGTTMLDLVECQVQLVGMAFRPTELATIVGEYGADRDVMGFIEGQDVVVEHGCRRLGTLGGVQEAEGQGTVGIDDDLQVDAATPLIWPTQKVSWQKSLPGWLDSTCLSRKAGFCFSMNWTSSVFSSMACPACCCFSLSQR